MPEFSILLQLLAAFNSVLIVGLSFFIRNWIIKVETKLDSVVTYRYLNEKIEAIEKTMATANENNTQAHIALWQHARGHQHVASCNKIQNHCIVKAEDVILPREG